MFSKREFRGNNICGSLTSFGRSECILPVHFVLLARMDEIWYEKYTHTTFFDVQLTVHRDKFLK